MNKLLHDIQIIQGNIAMVRHLLRELKQVMEYKLLLKEHGWDVCSRIFHPEMNLYDEQAFEKYAILKTLHENMKMDGEL